MRTNNGTLLALILTFLAGACESVQPPDPARGRIEAVGAVTRTAVAGDSVVLEVRVIDSTTRQAISHAYVLFEVPRADGVTDSVRSLYTNAEGIAAIRFPVDTVARTTSLRATYRNGPGLTSVVEFSIRGTPGPPSRAARDLIALGVGATMRASDLVSDRYGNIDSTRSVTVVSLAPSVIAVEGNLLRGVTAGVADLRITLPGGTVQIRAHALAVTTFAWTEASPPRLVSGSSMRRLLVAGSRTFRLAGSSWLLEPGLPDDIRTTVAMRDGTAWSISGSAGSRILWQSSSEGAWVNATAQANGLIPDTVYSLRVGPVLLSCNAARSRGILRRLTGDGARIYPDSLFSCGAGMLLGAPNEIVMPQGFIHLNIWDGTQWRLVQMVPLHQYHYTFKGGGAGPNGGAHWSETACFLCKDYVYAGRVVRLDPSLIGARITAIQGSVGMYDSTATWIAATSDTSGRAVARSESATRIRHEILGDLPVTQGRRVEAGPWIDFDNVMWYVDRLGTALRIVRVDLP